MTWFAMVIGLSGVQFREYSGEWFEIMNMITQERYDTKYCCQLIMSGTKCEKLSKSKVEERLSLM